jgi:hypothetical protein
LSRTLGHHLRDTAASLRQKRILLPVVLGLVWVGAASAASDDWTRTASIAPGARLTVKTFSGEEKRGTLRSAAADSVSLTVNGVALEIQRSEVARFRVYTPSRHLRNVLIGAAIGAAAGIGAGFATCPTCVGEQSSGDFQQRLGLGALAGAAVGSAGGMLVSPYKTVYSRRR